MALEWLILAKVLRNYTVVFPSPGSHQLHDSEVLRPTVATYPDANFSRQGQPVLQLYWEALLSTEFSPIPTLRGSRFGRVMILRSGKFLYDFCVTPGSICRKSHLFDNDLLGEKVVATSHSHVLECLASECGSSSIGRSLLMTFHLFQVQYSETFQAFRAPSVQHTRVPLKS